MLCLSGFELYSRWVPLINDTKNRDLRHDKVKVVTAIFKGNRRQLNSYRISKKIALSFLRSCRVHVGNHPGDNSRQ